MTRGQRWMVGFVAVVPVVACAVGGFASWQDRCGAAVPAVDDPEQLTVVPPEEFGDRLTSAVRGDHPDPTAVTDQLVTDAGQQTGLVGSGPLFTAERWPGPLQTDGFHLLVGDRVAVSRFGDVISVLDSSGEVLSTREQRAHAYQRDNGEVLVDDQLVLLQETEHRRLVAATLDLTESRLTACTRIGSRLPDSFDGLPAVAAPTGYGTMAVVQHRPDRIALSVVDPRGGSFQLASATLDIESMPRDVRGAGRVVVASSVPGGDSSWEVQAFEYVAEMPPGTAGLAEDLRLRARR